jgi:hypothetical protein
MCPWRLIRLVISLALGLGGLLPGLGGGVSNVGIDGNNLLYIKIIGAAISTFETLPTFLFNEL